MDREKPSTFMTALKWIGTAFGIAGATMILAKLNGVEPQAWLTDIVARIAEHKITKLDELMPWRFAETSA